MFLEQVLAATAGSGEVPLFLSGFIFEISGENHTKDLVNCFHSKEDIAQDSQKAINDISQGRYFKGVRYFGQLIRRMPEILADCHSSKIDDSLHLLTDWVAVIEHPHHMAE